MIKELEYSCTFPTTGRTLSGRFVFQKGFGAIVGPNESGKSFILEMLRFSLFGTAALRGTTGDYKNLKASLTFDVRNDTYTVSRSINTAKVLRGGAEIAKGVKAVNQKIADVLGFGLTVFDVSCAANQGNIEKLGDMKPTERKQMVDSVIGLAVIDELTKWCNDEALSLTRLIEGMDRNLTEPVAPTMPAGYRPSAEIQVELSELRVLHDELQQLNGWLAATKEEPGIPVETTTRSTEELQDAIRLNQRYAAVARELALLPDAPSFDPAQFEGQHEAFELWQERETFLRNHPRTMTQDEIDLAHGQHNLWQEFRSAELAEEKLAGVLDNADHHCCPACAHKWPVEEKLIGRLRERAEAARAAVAGTVKPTEPDVRAIALAESQLQAWDKDAGTWERLKDVPEAPAPSITRRQLAELQAAVAAQASRPALEAEVAELKAKVEDIKELNRVLRERITYEAGRVTYEKERQAYEMWLIEAAAKRTRAAELSPMVAGRAALEESLMAAVQFEQSQKRFETEITTFIARKAEIEKLQAEADGYRRGKAALVLLRKLVKQHLIPSLNRVASHLIKQMTGGERQVITVTDDFDITVDGQPLDTLSGSGKAVANLSLRLGLGQVLTNGVFSVFLGDEIDASMDKDRASKTALTLEYLAQKVSQILLVSHKYPNADYYIELGKNDEQNDRRADQG